MTPLQDPKMKLMINRKGLSKNRIQSYGIVFKDYCRISNKTPTELIDEAREEQEPYLGKNNQILFTPKSERKVGFYVSEYYKYLKEKELSPYSVDAYLRMVYAFYNEYDIELPKKVNIKLPKVIIREGDLATIEDIRLAVESTNNLRNKAIILLVATSGMRRGAVVDLTIADFIEATKEYHNSNNIQTILEMKNIRNIVPNWLFFPTKTEEYDNICLTFNTPECTEYTIKYLKTRKNLKPTDSLFELGPQGISRVFRELNDKLFGKTETTDKRIFMPHRLRKFFLSTFRKKTNDLFTLRLVAGHALPAKIDDNYQEIPVVETKQQYVKVIPALSIRDTKVHDFKTKEYLKLEQQLEEKDHKYNEIKETQVDIADQFQKILEFAKTDPEGFIKHMKKEVK
jgi:integrase